MKTEQHIIREGKEKGGGGAPRKEEEQGLMRNCFKLRAQNEKMHRGLSQIVILRGLEAGKCPVTQV